MPDTPNASHPPADPRNRQPPAGRRRPYALCLLVSLIASAVVVPVTFAEDIYVVSQRNREFWPNELKLKRGAVVHIVNDDRVTHHVFIKNEIMKFDSGEQPVGKTVELIFDKKGRFAIRCAIHPLMRLNIEVE